MLAAAQDSNYISILALTVGTLVISMIAYVILRFAARGSIGIGPIKLDFEKDVSQIRENLEQVSSETPPEDRQYALMREYHSRGLAQSTQSHWFSLISATIGFGVIISAVIVSLTSNDVKSGATAAQLIAGTIIESVSGLFFVQSNKARELMVAFFDKLRDDRKLDESLALARGMDVGDVKNRLNSVLALSFSGNSDIDLMRLVVGGGSDEGDATPEADSSTNPRRLRLPRR